METSVDVTWINKFTNRHNEAFPEFYYDGLASFQCAHFNIILIFYWSKSNQSNDHFRHTIGLGKVQLAVSLIA